MPQVLSLAGAKHREMTTEIKLSDKDLTFKRIGQRMRRTPETSHLDENDGCALSLLAMKQV
jgi:hypothetical protein